MMTSPPNNEGWFEWKPIAGTLQKSDYEALEKEFEVTFPPSFIEWHRAYYFLDADCSLVRLPHSNPLEPLKEIRKHLNWYIPQQLIPQKLYPFGDEGNDSGPLVFDGRHQAENDEFPILLYDQDYGGDLNGLSEVVFSSFPKLLQCLTHFMTERKSRKDFDIVLDFFAIDPEGAGKPGVDYWLAWSRTLRATSNDFDS